MKVCLFVWNLYKSTFLNRSEPNFAHVSPLVWRRSYGMYGPHSISTFPPFRRILSGASADSCAEDGCRRQSPPLLRYISCWCDVTDVTCTVRNAQKTRRSERNACVWKWKPDETGRK